MPAGSPSSEDETPVAQRRPQLRDVSRDVAGGEPGGEPEEATGMGAERSEELRKKVRETRARLTERLEGSRGGEQGDRDLGPEL
jgi:hypothetical protein